MTPRRFVVVLLLASTSMQLTAAAPPAALADRVIEAYGGAAGWKNVAAVRETGKVLSGMQGEGTVVREWVRPDNLRVNLAYAGSSEKRVVTGLSGWRDDEPVRGPQLDAMILQCSRIALPALLLDHRKEVRELGRQNRDGRELDVLEVPLTTYMSVELEIDPASARVLRSIGRAAVPGTTTRLEFIAVYDDFRKVDGLLFALREANYASGFRTGLTTLEKIEVRRTAAE